MDRAWQSGAIATPPAAPVSPSMGYPTVGNPGTGTPATKPGDWWYHMMTEELRAIVVAAGLTPSHSNVAQVLAALRSAGVFQTAVLGDTTTKGATNEFVRKNGRAFSFVKSVSATGALVDSEVANGIVYFESLASAITCTLPARTNIPPGTTIQLINLSAVYNATVVAAGGNSIYNYASGIIVGPGSTLTLCATSSTTWLVIGGTAGAAQADVFASSLAVNGYKKIPDKLSPTGFFILQFMQATATASGNSAFSFPIAFPNACLRIALGFQLTGAGNNYMTGWNTKSVNGFQIYNPNAAPLSHDVFAVGY